VDVVRSGTLLLNFSPSIVGVILLRGSSQDRGLLTEVFLEHLALLVHHKTHDPRDTVICRPCDEREASDHVAINHIVIASARWICPLPSEDLVKIPVIGLASFVRGKIILI